MIFTNIDIYPIITKFSPVSQNVIGIDIEKNFLDISYISKELNRIIPLKRYNINSIIPKEQYKRKAWVVLNAITNGPTMVYCNRPTDCRKTADEISKMLDLGQIDLEIVEVINFIEKYIHPQYHLINYLRKGVAFHYGSMPSSIRMAIESLFSNKYLDTLCCTSTLMEGVNLAAKNIVVYKPRSGMASPMKDIEFYNLGGRAGRLMKDFCGNIYCIENSEKPIFIAKYKYY